MFPIKWLDESQKCSMSDLCCKDNKLGLHETRKHPRTIKSLVLEKTIEV